MEAILADPDLTAGEKNIALRLALHKNLKTGLCNPGVDTLAAGTAMTDRGVRIGLDKLAEKGRIARNRGGRGPGDSNSYELLRVNHGSPFGNGANETPSTDRETAERVNGRAKQGEHKGEEKEAKGGTRVQANTENTTNTKNNTDDGDGDRDADCAVHLKKREEVKSLVRQLAVIAGLPPDDAGWPTYWQNADAVVSDWLVHGFPPDAIIAGARITMQRKQDREPPNSIEYFSAQIAEVAAVRGRGVRPGSLPSRKHLQEVQNRLVEQLGGWSVAMELTEGELNQVTERFARGHLPNEELHRLRIELQSRKLNPKTVWA